MGVACRLLLLGVVSLLLLLLLLHAEAKDSVDVVIIGAGVAGLSAGRYLLQSTQQKYKVTVLEARNRTGGRVWTNLDAFAGAVGGDADCGASWILGGDVGNPIRDLAGKFKITTNATDEDDVVLKRNGDVVSSNDYNDQYVEYVLMMRDLDYIDVTDFGNISVRTTLGKLGYEDRLSDPLVSWFLSNKEASEGASIEKLSIARDNSQSFKGTDRVFPAGYSQVTQSLQRGAGGEQPLNVLFNQVVRRVVVSNGSVTVSTQSAQFQADRLIVALPLGVLKSGDVVFDPTLSASKQEAISKMGFGLVGKVFLKFAAVFWDQKRPFFGYVSEDISKRGFLTFWMNGYYVSGTPTLIGFLSGDSAISAETMSDDAIRSEAMIVVRKLFGSSAPTAIGFFRTRWQSDPYSRGAYSYLAVGSAASHRATLGLAECPLHFSGEHTETTYFSTVHGAYLSGIRAAKEIDDAPLQCSNAVSATRLSASLLAMCILLFTLWLEIEIR